MSETQLGFGFERPPRKRKARLGRPKKLGAGVSHLQRPALSWRHPVHVTLRMRKEVWNLRSRRCFRVIAKAFWAATDRQGFGVVHFSVQGNHLHLVTEATDKRELSRGVQGLAIRMARALNRVMERQGKVFADRYHSRILKTPTEVRRAVAYVLDNHRKHFGTQGLDPYASSTNPHLVVMPHTWLLQFASPPPSRAGPC